MSRDKNAKEQWAFLVFPARTAPLRSDSAEEAGPFLRELGRQRTRLPGRDAGRKPSARRSGGNGKQYREQGFEGLLRRRA